MKKIYSVCKNERNSFYELWQQRKQLKTMGRRLHLIFTMRHIHISFNLDPLAKFSTSRRSTESKDIHPYNISQMIKKTILIYTNLATSCVMERTISFWASKKFNGNWDNKLIRISHWRESYCRTNTREINKKSINPKEQYSESQCQGFELVGKLTIWARPFETEQLQLSLSDLSGPPEQASQSLWWMLNSPKRNILAARMTERTTSLSDRRDSYGWVLGYNHGQNIWDKLYAK